MGPGDLDGKLSVSLRRAVPFPSLFMLESPGKPGERGPGVPAWMGVDGEESNVEFTVVRRVKGAGLSELPSSLAVLVLLKVGASNPDAPFVVGNPEISGPL
jgi:hypothetical protein